MKSIDVKIARSETEWRKIRYKNMGVRQSAGQLLRALSRSAAKRINCAVRNISPAAKKSRFKPSYDETRENLVVSLTTTPDRIGTILPTLYSLAAQKRKPDLIVLWLGRDRKYPEWIVSRIRTMGICIRFRKDLGPDTKYYYAFREYKKDLVITVDDDIIYHNEMTEELRCMHLKYPDAVIARRVHKIRFDQSRRLVRYKDWIWEYTLCPRPSHELFATGVGGVLYPPAVMRLKCWESTDFLKVCPKADDIWLKFCELAAGVRVCAVSNSKFRKDCANLRALKTSLAGGNVDKGRNDKYMRKCAQYFGFADDLCERILGE